MRGEGVVGYGIVWGSLLCCLFVVFVFRDVKLNFMFCDVIWDVMCGVVYKCVVWLDLGCIGYCFG